MFICIKNRPGGRRSVDLPLLNGLGFQVDSWCVYMLDELNLGLMLLLRLPLSRIPCTCC